MLHCQAKIVQFLEECHSENNDAAAEMVSQPIMNAIQKVAPPNLGIALKGSSIHRTHYSAPTGGGYHQHHHVYHVSDAEGYGHGHSHHSEHGGGKKRSIALSALTLLAFLFFLNILQNCLDDQMDQMNQQQVIVMSSRLQKFKEAQKRTAELKAVVADSNAGKTNNERNYEKLQRKVDTITNSKSYPNISIKINNKNEKHRIGRP